MESQTVNYQYITNNQNPGATVKCTLGLKMKYLSFVEFKYKSLYLHISSVQEDVTGCEMM